MTSPLLYFIGQGHDKGPLRFLGKGYRLHYLIELSISYCGMGDIDVASFRKYNLPLWPQQFIPVPNAQTPPEQPQRLTLLQIQLKGQDLIN